MILISPFLTPHYLSPDMNGGHFKYLHMLKRKNAYSNIFHVSIQASFYVHRMRRHGFPFIYSLKTINKTTVLSTLFVYSNNSSYIIYTYVMFKLLKFTFMVTEQTNISVLLPQPSFSSMHGASCSCITSGRV